MSRLHVEQLLDVFAEIEAALPGTVEEWRSSRIRQPAVQRLWILAGNLAEAHRVDASLNIKVQPWSELVGFRNRLAHMLPDGVDHDRVYAETTADLPRLRNDIPPPGSVN